MKGFMGIDVESIADRCARQISKHRHEMSNPEIEASLKEISHELGRIAQSLETIADKLPK